MTWAPLFVWEILVFKSFRYWSETVITGIVCIAAPHEVASRAMPRGQLGRKGCWK